MLDNDVVNTEILPPTKVRVALTIPLEQAETSLNRCSCANLVCEPPPRCRTSHHIVYFVQHDVNAISLVRNIHHKLRLWQWDEWCFYIANLQHKNFLGCWHTVECDSRIICNNAHLNFFLRDRSKTWFQARDDLMIKTRLNCINACVQ